MLSPLKTLRLLVVLVSLFLCVSTAFTQAQKLELRPMAAAITADGIGTIVNVKDNGSPNAIVIFEENHTSVLNNLEIAIMLDRIYSQYGAATIGVEGAWQVLDASWFHALPAANDVKAGIAARNLVEGEIADDEWMALVHPDVTVEGLEKQQEYLTNASDGQAVGASNVYFVAFASLLMNSSQQSQAHQLLAAGDPQAYFDYVLSFDSWSHERYQLLYKTANTSMQHMTEIVGEIIARQHALGFDQYSQYTTAEANLEQERAFYAGVDQRSYTLADSAVTLLHNAQLSLLPIVIGPAHTELVSERLDEAGVSYIVLDPSSLNPLANVGLLDAAALDRKNKQESVDADGLLGALIDGRTVKFRPVLDQPLYERKATGYWAFDKLAQSLSQSESVNPAQPTGSYTLDATLLHELQQYGFEIVPGTLELVNDSLQPGNDASKRALVFEVSLPQIGSVPALQFWAKVNYINRSGNALPTPQELLVEARQRLIDTANQAPSSGNFQLPDAIPVTANTLAMVAKDRAALVPSSVGEGVTPNNVRIFALVLAFGLTVVTLVLGLRYWRIWRI